MPPARTACFVSWLPAFQSTQLPFQFAERFALPTGAFGERSRVVDGRKGSATNVEDKVPLGLRDACVSAPGRLEETGLVDPALAVRAAGALQVGLDSALVVDAELLQAVLDQVGR